LNAPVKAAAAAVCALASFSALAGWQLGTQGLVSFTYGGGKGEFFCDKPVSVKQLPGGKGWTSMTLRLAALRFFFPAGGDREKLSDQGREASVVENMTPQPAL